MHRAREVLLARARGARDPDGAVTERCDAYLLDQLLCRAARTHDAIRAAAPDRALGCHHGLQVGDAMLSHVAHRADSLMRRDPPAPGSGGIASY